MQDNNFYSNAYVAQTNSLMRNNYNVNSHVALNNLPNMNSQNFRDVRTNNFQNNVGNPMDYLTVPNTNTHVLVNNTHPYYQSTLYNNQLSSSSNNVPLLKTRNDIFQETYNSQRSSDTTSLSNQSNFNRNFSPDSYKNLEYIRNRIQNMYVRNLNTNPTKQQEHHGNVNNNFIVQNTDLNRNYYVLNKNNEANKILQNSNNPNKNCSGVIMGNRVIPSVVGYSAEPSNLSSHVLTYDNSSPINIEQAMKNKKVRRKSAATKSCAMNENSSMESNSNMNLKHQSMSYYNAIPQDYINMPTNNNEQKQISSTKANDTQNRNKSKEKLLSMTGNINHDVIHNIPNSYLRVKRISQDQEKMRLEIEKSSNSTNEGNIDFNKNMSMTMGEDNIRKHTDANSLHLSASSSNKNDKNVLRRLSISNDSQLTNNIQTSNASSVVTNSFGYYNTINTDATSHRSIGVVIPENYNLIEKNNSLKQKTYDNVSSSKILKNTNVYDKQNKHDNPVRNVDSSFTEKVDTSNTNSIEEMDYRVLNSISDISMKDVSGAYKSMMSYYIKPFKKGRCLKFNPKTNENSYRNRKKGCVNGVQDNKIIANLHYKGPYYVPSTICQNLVHSNKANECNHKNNMKINGSDNKMYPNQVSGSQQSSCIDKSSANILSKTSNHKITDADNQICEILKYIKGNNDVLKAKNNVCVLDGSKDNSKNKDIENSDVSKLQNNKSENKNLLLNILKPVTNKSTESIPVIVKNINNTDFIQKGLENNMKQEQQIHISPVVSQSHKTFTHIEVIDLDDECDSSEFIKPSVNTLTIVNNTNKNDVKLEDCTFDQAQNEAVMQIEYHLKLKDCTFDPVQNKANIYFENDLKLKDSTFDPVHNEANIYIENDLKLKDSTFDQIQNKVDAQIENQDMPSLIDYVEENIPKTIIDKPKNVDLIHQSNTFDQPPLETILHVTTSSTGIININVELKKEDIKKDIVDIWHGTNKNVEKNNLEDRSKLRKPDDFKLHVSSKNKRSHDKHSKNKIYSPDDKKRTSRNNDQKHRERKKSYNKTIIKLESSGICNSKSDENKEKTKKKHISLKKECKVTVPANERALADSKFYRCHICETFFVKKEMYEKDVKSHRKLLYEKLFGPNNMSDNSSDLEISRSVSNYQEEKKNYDSLSNIPMRVSPILIKIKKPKSVFKKTKTVSNIDSNKSKKPKSIFKKTKTVSNIDSNKSKIIKRLKLPQLIARKQCKAFEDSFKCTSCNSCFSTRLLLDLHVKKSLKCKVNFNEVLFNFCKDCGTQFNNNQSLNLHECSKDNINFKDYHCKVCNKRFIDVSLFDVHVKNHYSRMAYS